MPGREHQRAGQEARHCAEVQRRGLPVTAGAQDRRSTETRYHGTSGPMAWMIAPPVARMLVGKLSLMKNKAAE